MRHSGQFRSFFSTSGLTDLEFEHSCAEGTSGLLNLIWYLSYPYYLISSKVIQLKLKENWQQNHVNYTTILLHYTNNTAEITGKCSLLNAHRFTIKLTLMSGQGHVRDGRINQITNYIYQLRVKTHLQLKDRIGYHSINTYGTLGLSLS